MTAANWIDLVGVVLVGLGMVGGGGVAVAKGSSKLTRIAVALEQAGEKLEGLGSQMTQVTTQVAAHGSAIADHTARLEKGGL